MNELEKKFYKKKKERKDDFIVKETNETKVTLKQQLTSELKQSGLQRYLENFRQDILEIRLCFQ